MRLSRFLSLAAAVGGLLGLALSVIAAVALRLVGLAGYTPILAAGLVAGLGVGLLGGVWIEQSEELARRDRSRPGRGTPPRRGHEPDDDERRTRLFGPLAFGLTFVTMGTVAGLSAAEQLAANSTWAPLAGIAWLTLAIAGGAGGIIAGAVWQVVIERMREAAS